MGDLWEAFLNLFYPPSCCACGQPTERPQFCSACRTAIAAPHPPLCPSCGAPFRTPNDLDHPCGRCLARRPCFGRARACAIYDAADAVTHPLKSVLHRYKYSRDVSLAPLLARLVVDRCPLALATYDVLIPVPLHLARLRWRGFNQALFLAHALARTAGIAVDPFSLQRTRPTRPQVELDEKQRRRNVAGAFQVIRPQHMCRRRVLLVDDVYTTGATVDECARVLLEAGADNVDVLVLARAVLQ